MEIVEFCEGCGDELDSDNVRIVGGWYVMCDSCADELEDGDDDGIPF